MNIVVVGHVDHGKSTLVGRLLVDTGSLPHGKLEQVKAHCERNSRPFEYAFLLDALMEEQAQGITIDAARVFFKTGLRDYIIIDAPGHIEFLKNMVTGAARAEAALLVIDAKEGIEENSRRHGNMLSLLGVQQISVIVNKMDLVEYSEKAYLKICLEYGDFLSSLNITPAQFIPVSGFFGENGATRSKKMPWYLGPCVVEALDLFQSEPSLVNQAFRMSIQDVYKFTRGGDTRRILAGTIDSGQVQVGDVLNFYPSGRVGIIKTIEDFNHPVREMAQAGQAIGFTLTEQIYLSRGEVAVKFGQQEPTVTGSIRASIFWLGKSPMIVGKNYVLRCGTARAEVQLQEISRQINSSTLEDLRKTGEISQNSCAECLLRLDRSIAVDLRAKSGHLSRFVIVDNYKIAGGGVIIETFADSQTVARHQIRLRNSKWELSLIDPEERAERYNQKATLVLISSEKDIERKKIAKKLESRLFEMGRFVYYLGFGNYLYGVGADLRGKNNTFKEDFRRFTELLNMLLDTGIIVVATIAELTQENLETLKLSLGGERIDTIWIGETVNTNLVADLCIKTHNEMDAVQEIKRHLREKGALFKP